MSRPKISGESEPFQKGEAASDLVRTSQVIAASREGGLDAHRERLLGPSALDHARGRVQQRSRGRCQVKKADIAALVAVAKKVLDYDFGCGCCSWNEDSSFQPKASLREALKPFEPEDGGR